MLWINWQRHSQQLFEDAGHERFEPYRLLQRPKRGSAGDGEAEADGDILQRKGGISLIACGISEGKGRLRCGVYKSIFIEP